MPLVGDCCVNLSGRNVTVTDGNNRAIGELMNREFFTVIGAEGSLVQILLERYAYSEIGGTFILV